MTYQEIIKKNDATGQFNDAEQLTDFLDNYIDQNKNNVSDQEDNISEYADNLVPIYYHDIVKEWQENSDCHELTLEICGEYDQKAGIYKMMSSDLFYYYEQRLREDYDRLIELLDEQEK